MAKPLFFGDGAFAEDSLEQIEKIDREWDRSYVPGYSEKRVENERRRKDGLAELPTPRLQWVPVTKPDGTSSDQRDMMPWFQLGYRFVEEGDFARLGITGMPPTAIKGSDGLIRRGDVALAYVDEERAKFNQRRQANINAEAHAATVRGAVEVTESKNGVGSLMEMHEQLSAERPQASFGKGKRGG
jgi:hypothetical protein